MQYEKCAYCEKNIKEGAQVDHFVPQEEFVIGIDVSGKKQYNWNEANNWKNLLYSCSKCNGAKKKENPFKGRKRVIIDPTISDPEKYLDFNVQNNSTSDIQVLIIPKASSSLGRSTIEKLKLSTRTDHIGPLNLYALELENTFLTLIVAIRQGQDLVHANCQEKISKIKTSMFSNKQYAGFARAFYRNRLEFFERHEKHNIERILGRNVNLNIIIPKGVILN